MANRITVHDYLAGVEDLRRRELEWGVVREPPAPMYGHQSVVTRTTVLLDAHVRARALGIVCVAPIDVVLDKTKALIVQPDVIFVSAERTSIIRDQVWGAPDLVVEVTSPRTARRDRTTKLGWYRRYGVQECWIVDPPQRAVTVVDLTASGDRRVRRLTGGQSMASRVLPEFTTPADAFFS